MKNDNASMKYLFSTRKSANGKEKERKKKRKKKKKKEKKKLGAKGRILSP